jgi:GNAT superfamily N-acetyltransferase
MWYRRGGGEQVGNTEESREVIRLVRASAADAETLMQICVEAFAEDIEQWGGPIGIDQVEAHLDWMGKYLYYKVLVEEKTVGGILVDPQDDEHYVLSAMFIAPESQSQGMGTQAISLLEEAHPAATKWSLSAVYSSHRSHHFYEKLGYVRVGETKPGDYPEIPDERFHLFLYEKRLGGDHTKG